MDCVRSNILYNKEKKSRMYIKITELLEMAQSGKTKQEILAHFNLDEKSYQDTVKKFSSKNRETLRRYLIGNAKRKNSNSDECQLLTTSKVCSEVAILDTSYIFSPACRFEKLKNAIVLPKVYEQLVIAHQKGSRKIRKFMHMILEDKSDVTFEKAVNITENVPAYEDPADIEILSYAKQRVQAHETVIPVVYTADKVLALRCKQQGIKFVFVDSYVK